MTTERGKQILADMESLAKEYDRRGDVTLRNQTLRGMEDVVGVSSSQIDAAKRRVMAH